MMCRATRQEQSGGWGISHRGYRVGALKASPGAELGHLIEQNIEPFASKALALERQPALRCGLRFDRRIIPDNC